MIEIVLYQNVNYYVFFVLPEFSLAQIFTDQGTAQRALGHCVLLDYV